MRAVLLAMLMSVWAVAAHAITVSNLDDVEHTLVFEHNPGNKIIRTIEPNGVLRLLQHTGTVHVQGTNHKLRVYGNDLLVIWKNGNLQIQKRRQATGRGD